METFQYKTMVIICLLFIITHGIIEREFFGISLINSKGQLLLCTYQDINDNFIRPVITAFDLLNSKEKIV